MPSTPPSERAADQLRQRREAGSVTAETAVLLPALVALLVLCLWSISAVGAKVRCIDAASTAARAMARGETAAVAVAAARMTAPGDAVFEISQEGKFVSVTVRAQTPLPGALGGHGPGLEFVSRAVALVER